MTKRADLRLVAEGLAPSRSAAQRLIGHGAVRWRLGSEGWQPLRKPGEALPEAATIEVTDDAELRWVSRGGLKLDGALHAAGLDVAGRTCLDVGQSTGGFTDVLLQHGAAHVVGLDVGHGQLHPRLRDHPRVTALEGVNARHLAPASLGHAMPRGGFGLVTGDLSFISLALVLPALAPLMAPDADLLMLVKPQFELQPGQIGKGGLVKDRALHAQVKNRIADACEGCALRVLGWLDSPVPGGDGNVEYFVRARPAPAAATRT